ncbi:MAG: radical SAM protein [Chloroflexi bacterium]|nr:radical SAM protein [Chloroflexota bacterium]
MNASVPVPRLISWEITRGCNLACAHCRAAANYGPYEGELSLQDCFSVIDSILDVGNPILILTGGEPLLRRDFFDIAGYAAGKGLRVVVGTNGTVITDDLASRMKRVPIPRVGISLDFPERTLQDKFRGVNGAFDAALKGIEIARRHGIEIQINCTITKLNAPYLDDLLKLALEIGAIAFHPFMLVPTGRGKMMEDQELPSDEYERVLNWIYDRQQELGDRIFFKPTDVPHYMRVVLQRSKQDGRKHEGGVAAGKVSHHGHGGMNSISRGCLAGIGFCFISHVGRVQGCGYLDVEAGNVKEKSFCDIWRRSPVFQQLRDFALIKGKCGACEYKNVCGGCRARAFEATGDYLEAEPYCLYRPARFCSFK